MIDTKHSTSKTNNGLEQQGRLNTTSINAQYHQIILNKEPHKEEVLELDLKLIRERSKLPCQ
jgi:hypothetical protein